MKSTKISCYLAEINFPMLWKEDFFSVVQLKELHRTPRNSCWLTNWPSYRLSAPFPCIIVLFLRQCWGALSSSSLLRNPPQHPLSGLREGRYSITALGNIPYCEILPCHLGLHSFTKYGLCAVCIPCTVFRAGHKITNDIKEKLFLITIDSGVSQICKRWPSHPIPAPWAFWLSQGPFNDSPNKNLFQF